MLHTLSSTKDIELHIGVCRRVCDVVLRVRRARQRRGDGSSSSSTLLFQRHLKHRHYSVSA